MRLIFSKYGKPISAEHSLSVLSVITFGKHELHYTGKSF